MKPCGSCGCELPLDAFYPDRTKRHGASSWCRACTLAHRKQQYADPSKRAVVLERNRNSAHRYREANKAKRKRQRLAMIAAYGGKCVCCGESTPEFLTIDHTHNDGAQERRQLSLSGSKIYAHLAKLGYPKDRYQLLCFNCNCAKGIHGRCPHEDAV
jgi:hypothetical protein